MLFLKFSKFFYFILVVNTSTHRKEKNEMERFLIDSFNAAYGLYQDIKTGNYREDREADELALKRNVARYSNFAAQYGLPQLNVEKASSVQISQYLEKSAKLIAAIS